MSKPACADRIHQARHICPHHPLQKTGTLTDPVQTGVAAGVV
jgi:hypothetical protein